MRDLSDREVQELDLAASGDSKLTALLTEAMEEFDRTGKIGPVKEARIRKRLAKVKKHGARR